ncbi:sensor histidine kinase [Chryseobacterium sp. MMS23-Vi53]|uniref:sensor histidine kinase n=1 Tax=Chryseobacterium sp. MMS23-Vi53 TaxID=3386644 RepID=UPI0039E8B1C9
MKKSLLLILFTFIHLFMEGQRTHLQVYNTDNGLPQNSVKDIIKDKYGFIWLTTENGIVRYDGSSFLVYKNFPLNSQRFTHFYGSVENDSIFTTGEYEKNILLHDKFPKITPLKNHSTVVYRNKKKYLLSCSHYSFASTGIGFFMNVANGRYFLLNNALIYSDFRSKREQRLNLQPLYKNASTIFALKDLLFYVDPITKNIITIKDGKIIGSFKNSLLSDHKTRIFWSQVNHQLFALNRGTIYICQYQDNELKLSKLVTLQDVKDENFMSIYFDKKYKKLFLGSSIDGLRILSFQDFTTVKRPSSNHESVFYSILPYSDSSVITTFGEVYSRSGLLENKNFKNTSPYFLDREENGNIIYLHEDHIKIYSKTSGDERIIRTKSLLLKDFFISNHQYFALFKDIKNPDGPEFNGVLAIYKDQSFNAVEKKIFFKNEPTKFIRLNQEYVLVGTVKCLYKISLKTNKIYKLTGNKELSIRNIIKTKDGNIWITTLGQGFYLLKNDRIIKMPYDADGNISSSHTLLEDAKGFFWISTNNGLYKVLETELLKYAQNKKHRIYYCRFSKDAGFNTNEFNGGSNIAGNRLKNGEFVLPSLNGLIFFDPLKIKSFYPENFYVERALVDNKEKNFKEKIYISQESNRLDLFIDVPYYSNLDNLVIEAKLSDFPNAKWENIGKDRKFSVSNLGYGHHIFMVRMLVSDDGKFIYKKIKIIIPPYFYQTFWFKIFLTGLFFLFIYFLVKWRISFLQKKNHELEEIVNSRTKILSDTVEKLEITKGKLHKEIEQQKKLIGTITHDITTPVKFIALTAKEILDQENFDEKRAGKILNSIYKSSDQLYNFTLTLKEYADIYSHHISDKTELYSLFQLIEEKKILFDEIAEKNNTLIQNNVDESLQLWISKNILSAIVHNLIDNSVKYTENGTITIENCIENENIILKITDTGIGMDEKKIEYYTRLQDNIENEKLLLQKYGMGLHLVLQLLQMIGGKIIFTKNEPQGTSFKLILLNKK